MNPRTSETPDAGDIGGIRDQVDAGSSSSLPATGDKAAEAREVLGRLNANVGATWIKRGLKVFPIAISWDDSKGKTNKRPLTDHGFKDATEDMQTLVQLVFDGSTRLREGEILACATVPGSGGYVVFDGDKDNGKTGVEYLDQELHLPPNTYRPVTASTGEHRWFRKRDLGVYVGNVSLWEKEGVDVRADAGYVVCPGTVTPWGNWTDGDDQRPWGTFATVPEALWNQMVESKTSGGSGGQAGGWKRYDPAVHDDQLHVSTVEVLHWLTDADRGEHRVNPATITFHTRDDGEPYVQVARPGKGSGVSATVGFIGPGVMKVFTSNWPGLTSGVYDLFDLIGKGSDEGEDRGDDGDLDDIEDRTLTDDGNGLALVAAHGETIRFVSGIGWHEWDGQRWTPDREERVRELAKQVFRRFPTHTKEDFGHARYSLSAVGTSNALRQAQSDPAVRLPADAMDTDPYLLNTPGGIVDLRTGTITEHDPERLQSKITAVTPQRILTPRFTTFLQETFRDDQALIDYVQVLLGYALIGEVREHVLPIATGPGGNGKGVLFDTLTALLGDVDTGGYSLSANEGLLSSTNSHPTELARLRGARLVIAAEQDGKRPFAEARVKRLTGGDAITGRKMRMDFFTFTPSHTIIVVGNELPPVETGGPSFWRRARVVPFVNTPPKPDPNLKTVLLREGPGILQWMIDGAIKYLSDGLPEPDAVMAASRDYQQSEDPLNVWFSEHLEVDEDAGPVPCSVLYERYRHWCKDNGHEPQGQRTITYRMQSEYGLQLVRANVQGRRQNCLTPLKWTVTFASDL